LKASASSPVNTRAKVRALGARIRCAHGSRRPPSTASVCWEQPAAHSAAAAGESCLRVLVMDHLARCLVR
jgi:hypothetical protein